MPSVHDPIPGWVDNLYGPMGLLTAGGKGILMSMYGNGDVNADLIPVDMIINGLLVAAYDYMTNK